MLPSQLQSRNGIKCVGIKSCIPKSSLEVMCLIIEYDSPYLPFYSTEPCDGGFLCEMIIGIVCLYQYQVCDSFAQCTDFSDENQCGKL